MLFPLKLKLILRKIALFYTNFTTNSRICEAKYRGITLGCSSEAMIFCNVARQWYVGVLGFVRWQVTVLILHVPNTATDLSRDISKDHGLISWLS